MNQKKFTFKFLVFGERVSITVYAATRREALAKRSIYSRFLRKEVA